MFIKKKKEKVLYLSGKEKRKTFIYKFVVKIERRKKKRKIYLYNEYKEIVWVFDLIVLIRHVRIKFDE